MAGLWWLNLLFSLRVFFLVRSIPSVSLRFPFGFVWVSLQCPFGFPAGPFGFPAASFGFPLEFPSVSLRFPLGFP